MTCALVTGVMTSTTVATTKWRQLLHVRCSKSFTVYHIHTRSVFSVKGVNKRFSDFKELDGLLRKQFTFLRPLPAGEPAAALSPW